jgi:hypothetical protein
MSLPKRVYEIDGAKFSNFAEFCDTFSRVVLVDHTWHGNLDAFNDFLRGGWGTPEGGYVIRWKNSSISRERLGYPETVRWFERWVTSNSDLGSIAKLKDAQANRGTTLFDWIVEIIRDHGEGGHEPEDGVELILD